MTQLSGLQKYLILSTQLSELKKNVQYFQSVTESNCQCIQFSENDPRWLKSPENRLNQPCFGHLNIKKFGFVSDFDIRNSNFSTFGTPKVECWNLFYEASFIKKYLFCLSRWADFA